MSEGEEPYEGMWDFKGACAPNEDGSGQNQYGQETFTLGLFKWERRSGGKGLKPGKVRFRVKGQVSYPADAYSRAREECQKRNRLGVE
jgi:hypothetical protein